MKNVIRLTLFSTFCLTAVVSYGQGWDENSKLEDTEIIVEKDRKIELPVASRNFEKVKVEAPRPETQAVEYVINDLKLANHPVPVQMRVLTIKQEDLPLIYGNHVRAALGNYFTPYLHGYFHNTRNTQYSVGAEVRHLSSANGPVEKGKSGMSSTGLQLTGEAYRESLTIGAMVGYEREGYHFYGYDRNLLKEISEKDIEQKFNRINSRVFINNSNSQSKFKTELGLGYNYISDNHEMKEGDFRVDATGNYALTDKSAIRAELNGSFIGYDAADFSASRSYFRARPYYQANFGNLNLVLGGTIAYSNDTLNDAPSVYIYPHLQVAYQLLENTVTVFGGITGDLERNSMFSLTRENQWLAGAIPTTGASDGYVANTYVQNSSKQLDIFAGVRGTVGPQLGYQLRAGYQRYSNLYFYNNSPIDSARFSLFYDNGVTSAPYANAELNYTASERLRLGVKVNYTAWNVVSVRYPGMEIGTDRALHRPNLISNLFATYNISNKIFFTADFYYIGKTDALNLITNQINPTDNVTDLSLKIDYRFSNRFSAFFMLNNVLSKKYERYLYYPVQGIQVLGGVSYSF